MADINQNQDNKSGGKAAYEARRAERLGKKMTDARKGSGFRFVKKWAVWIAAAAVLAYGAYWTADYVSDLAPKTTDFSREIPVMGEEHIPEGSLMAEYNSNPPTSGPHFGKVARPGFREEAVDDRHLIHNLEHGDVWISYHPRVSGEIKEALKQFSASKVVITPREANESDIALAAWGRLDTFNIENNVLDTSRVRDFITRYLNTGPEKGVPADHGGA